MLISVLLSSGMAMQTDALLIDKIAAVVDGEIITYNKAVRTGLHGHRLKVPEIYFTSAGDLQGAFWEN